MHITLTADDLRPIIDAAVRSALDQYSTELRSLLATAGQPQLLTVPEAAKLLGVCDRTVRNMVDRGELVASRIGGNVRLTRSDLDALIESGRTKLSPA